VEIEINEHKFVPNPACLSPCVYPYEYWKQLKLVQDKKIIDQQTGNPITERQLYRHLAQVDPFFFCYFILGIKECNVPFVARASNELEKDDLDRGLYLWSREHYKSTLITTVKVIQKVLNNPEETIAIFSYSKSAAIKLLRPIKRLFEQSTFLKWLFPDILYENPEVEADKWSEEIGLLVKRRSVCREHTIEAHGLIESSPTGSHFSGRVYDDVETLELANSPDLMEKLIEAFDMSDNLGRAGGWHCVVGTTYTHTGLLQNLRERRRLDGSPYYKLSLKPATDDGTPNGKPVLLSQERLDDLRTKPAFFSQQLLDPTPRTNRPIRYERIKHVPTHQIPQKLWKFMAVDPAGTNKNKHGDSWGIIVAGVRPFRDDVGASDVYILDMLAEQMEVGEAMDKIVRMYKKHGRILKLGVERVASTTFEIHVTKALQAAGISCTLDNGRMEILKPAGRHKHDRIAHNLQWSLDNGKIFMSTGVDAAYKERLRMEMDKFPFWHDDLLDSLAYIYDLFRNYRFGAWTPEHDILDSVDPYDAKESSPTSTAWMTV
jgi:hypothetical protein